MHIRRGNLLWAGRLDSDLRAGNVYQRCGRSDPRQLRHKSLRVNWCLVGGSSCVSTSYTQTSLPHHQHHCTTTTTVAPTHTPLCAQVRALQCRKLVSAVREGQAHVPKVFGENSSRCEVCARCFCASMFWSDVASLAAEFSFASSTVLSHHLGLNPTTNSHQLLTPLSHHEFSPITHAPIALTPITFLDPIVYPGPGLWIVTSTEPSARIAASTPSPPSARLPQEAARWATVPSQTRTSGTTPVSRLWPTRSRWWPRLHERRPQPGTILSLTIYSARTIMFTKVFELGIEWRCLQVCGYWSSISLNLGSWKPRFC